MRRPTPLGLRKYFLVCNWGNDLGFYCVMNAYNLILQCVTVDLQYMIYSHLTHLDILKSYNFKGYLNIGKMTDLGYSNDILSTQMNLIP